MPVTQESRTSPADAAASDAIATGEPDHQQVAALTVAAVASKTQADPKGDATAPVYPTRLPPPALLSYQLRRGMLSGQGELRWQHDGRRYEVRLEGRVALFGTILTQVSRGGFDAAGLAPERHTDKRRNRGEQAANFQRAAGIISFSGPATQYPLVAGAQDRVSWMLQLAAIGQAWSKRPGTGTHVAMFVAGARGDGDVWSFRVEGTDAVNTPMGMASAIKLMREPRKQYDTKVEIWLDPARHHLPVRARMTEASGDPFELILSEEVRTP